MSVRKLKPLYEEVRKVEPWIEESFDDFVLCATREKLINLRHITQAKEK